MLWTFVIAVAFTRLGILLVVRMAPRWGLLDKPDSGRKLHAVAKPAVGLALGFGVLSSGVMWLGSLYSWAALAGSLALLAVGVDDDRRPRSALCKLAAQLLIAALTVWGAQLSPDMVSLLGMEVPLHGAAYYAVAVLWIAALTNAFNLIDGSDGLAIGIAWLTAGSFALFAADTLEQQIALALLGAASVFWWYNKPSARMFLGDGGAYFVGGMLALLSLHRATTQAPGGFDLVKLGLLFLVPLGDTVYSIVRRLAVGRSILRADDQHIHHRLQRALGCWPMLILLYALTCLGVWLAWWR